MYSREVEYYIQIRYQKEEKQKRERARAKKEIGTYNFDENENHTVSRCKVVFFLKEGKGEGSSRLRET